VLGTARSADGISIAYEVQGAGTPALAFVHGWSCDRTYWRHQLPDFAQRHVVVAVDLAGHGGSGEGRAEYTMPAYGKDVAAVANELGLDEIVLVGHSMGGDVNVEAALELDARVVAQVWVDVYFQLEHSRDDGDVQEIVGPLRRDFRGEVQKLARTMFLPDADPKVADWIVHDMSSAPPYVGLNEAAYSLTNMAAMLEHMRRLRAPMVAINTDWRPTNIESLASHGIRTVHMPGVGHFGMMEKPDEFNRLLGQVVESFAVTA
jgi:pimeloyl-ACP methyl ester carboxylesterase